MIRHIFRTSAGTGFPAVDLVVLPKAAILDADPGGLSRDFKAVLKRCGVSIS